MEGESFYQTIIHNAPIGYVLFKLVYAAQEPVDLEFVEVNPAFEKIIGLTHEDVVGFGMSKFLPASKEFLDWISFCALVGQSDQAQEYLQYTPYRDCWYQGYVYSPKPGHVITLFYDVTEEKRISEQNSGLVSSLFDIIFELDQHLVVNNLYTGDEALLFLPREAIIGVQLPQLLPDKQLVAQLLKSCQDAERTGQPTNLEYHSILPDDKRWFRAIIVPVENVPAIKFRLVVRDITDQKTAENILKTFFMVASEFMCVVDQNYHLLYTNQAIMKEARDKPEGVTGYHFTEFVYPDDIAATREAMKRVLDNGKGDGFVNRCGFDGVTWNYIEWQATYFDGLFYLAGRNISEKIAAEEEMRRDNDRLLKLVEVLQQPFSSFKELIDFALEQGMELTGSKMGSFYLYNEVNNELKIVAHTQNIKEMCQIKELSRKVYSVPTSGIWTATVESKRPFYLNDYHSFTNNKNGYPSGHVEITRFLSVPIIGSNGLAALILMANKDNNYTDKDALQLTLFMNVVWRAGERKRAEIALSEEKERIRVTLESIGEGVISTDREGRVTMLNRIAETLTGWSSEMAKGKILTEVFDIIDECHRAPYPNPVQEVLDNGEIMKMDEPAILVSRDGNERLVGYSAAPIRGDGSVLLGVVLVFRDVTVEHRKKKRIIYLSQHDKLTGLYNREFIERELARLDEESQLPMTIILGDVNALKMTNDVFGHEAGDHLLVKTANILKEACRENDIIARWGGDEFIVVMPQTGNIEANRVCDDIRNQFSVIDSSPGSIALGYATREDISQSIIEILKEAEDYMYKRKLIESKSLRSSLIATITSTLDEKSHETEAHARRIREKCKEMGAAMGLREHQLNELELLSMLHDIGKIAVDDHILNKPGPLDDEECKEMRKHPEVGYRITQLVPELSVVAEYILCHHERWDGRGYPQGIAGESIPLLARIIAVADAYDAMTNDRPYRQAMLPEQAMAELVAGAGTQFDPQIVRVFLATTS